MASMALRVINRLATGFWPMVALFVLLLGSLYVLADFAESLERFGRVYVGLLLLNFIGIGFIALLIGVNIWRLIQRFRQRAAGARLTAKLVAMFIVLALVPVTIVYTFSLRFLRSGIDSWFDVEVERALDDALALSKQSLSLYTQRLQRVTERSAERLSGVSGEAAVRRLAELSADSDAAQLTLLGVDGHIIAVGGTTSTDVVPPRPPSSVLMQARYLQPYAGLDPVGDADLHVRVVVPVEGGRTAGQVRLLQALYPVPARLEDLAEGVQASVGTYRELEYLRDPLKTSYILTLTLALGLSVLTAIWAAFFCARRLMQPIHNLAEGTRAVAAGNYATRLPPSGRDELGFLVQSFNEMTRRLSDARHAAHASQRQVESQRAYLETVLERISTAVITLDVEGTLQTANEAAARILAVDLTGAVGQTLEALAASHAPVARLVDNVRPHLEAGTEEWQEQFELPVSDSRKMVVCRGTPLPDRPDLAGGWVIVFDDITALVRAQREAAWSEVARRLAHEVKNPLTPIQLASERLRHRLLGRLSGEEAEMVDRSTWTIIQQVESLKAMVRAFADYASTPTARFEPVDLDAPVGEVVELYGAGDGTNGVVTDLAPGLPPVVGDPDRLRQVLHNLIKNALDAGGDGPVRISTAAGSGSDVELTVRDPGAGIRADLVDRLFEPYMSGHPSGSGLGLAIVKKIVEEHGGSVAAANAADAGGAVLNVVLPTTTASGAWSQREASP
jgi:nitrogen fixation/metabolism regulation signal transduction histidine kinase